MSGLPAAHVQDFLEALRVRRAPSSAWYTDRDLFVIERDAMLRKEWHYAAHAGELSKVGDQIVQKVAGVPIVLVRTEQGAVRGYVNICRHRAHLVVLENQNQRSMQCMYHGWTYGLDGCLRAAPRSRTDPTFNEEDFPLAPIQVHQVGPMLWVNLDASARAFDAPILTHERDKSRYRFSFEKTWGIKANWKLFLDGLMADQALDEMQLRRGQGWLLATGDTRVEGERLSCAIEWIAPATFVRSAGDARGFDVGSVCVRSGDEIEFRNVTFVRDDMTEESEARRHASYQRERDIDALARVAERLQDDHAAGRAARGAMRSGTAWSLARLRHALGAGQEQIKVAGETP